MHKYVHIVHTNTKKVIDTGFDTCKSCSVDMDNGHDGHRCGGYGGHRSGGYGGHGHGSKFRITYFHCLV